MKNKKNIVRTVRATALLLSLCLMATLFVACTNSKETSGNGKNHAFPNKLELTVWNTQGTDYALKTVNDDVVEKWLFNKTNVRMKNVYGNDGGQWDSKLTKLVAGNNLPDILWCQAGQGAAHFKKLKELNVLSELTPEMIQKYAPEVWRRTPKHLWDKLAVDGKILGIPFNIPVSQVDEVSPELTVEERDKIKEEYQTKRYDNTLGRLWVRDDILKAIFPEAKSYDELVSILDGKQEPIGEELLDTPINTTEDFIEFMYRIKNLSMTENGKKVYAYGYVGDGNDNWEAISYLGAEMYGYKHHNYTATWNFEKEKIEIPLIGEMIKQVARTQNEMINDSVIDPESLAHTIDQFKEKVYNGQYAICHFERLGDVTLANNQLEQSGAKYKYRPLYTNIPAQNGYKAYLTQNPFGDSIGFLNTLKEEEIIQALNWINVQYSYEFEEIYNWGAPEDGLYREDENGRRSFVDESFTKYYVEGDLSALKVNDAKGLGGIAGGESFKMYVIPVKYSKWTPKIHVGYAKLFPTVNSGFGFPVNSTHVTNVTNAPPCQAYSAEYAEIPEVINYWGARERWESAVRKAFAATKDDFDKKWDEAMGILTEIVDVLAMEEKMTEIAKPLYEEIKRNQ